MLTALPEGDVGLVLNPGCDLPSSRAAAALAEKYPHVYAAAGIHPEDCAGFQDTDLKELRQLLAQPKIVAVGEIGLDYYWEENPPREFQQAVFRKQLALAEELALPVIVHDREAHGDTLDIIPGVSRRHRRVPLLLRLSGNGGGTAEAGLVSGF